MKLDNQRFDSRLVTMWCRDISNGIQDKLKTFTDNHRKIVVTTYIGSKANKSCAYINVKCQTIAETDKFVTVALEGEDMYIWVTLLMADYCAR